MKSTNRVRKSSITKPKSKQPSLKGGWKHLDVNIQISQEYLEEYKKLSQFKKVGWSAFITLSLREGAKWMQKWMEQERAKEKDQLLGLVFNGHPTVHLTKQLKLHRLN